MKVLIIHPQMRYYGGAELLITELCNQLSKRGIKNDILTLSFSEEVKKNLIDTRIISPKNKIKFSTTGFNSIKDLIIGIRILRKEFNKISDNYNVINFHNFPSTWTMFPKRKPSVWMLNEPPNLWSKPNAGAFLKILNKIRNIVDKFIINQSVNIICVADDFNKKRAYERYSRNSKIIYYGINYDFFSKGKKIKDYKKFPIKNKFVVLQSGMITEQKNQLESIKAIKIVKDSIPNILLVLAGKEDENYKLKLMKYITENKLEKYILFTGNLDRKILRDLYKTSNIGLFPVGKQGGWLAPFEFLCSEKPIIVSKEMGASSLIKKNNLGFVTNKYAEEIINIYKNYNENVKNAKIASKFIKTNLNWEIFSDKIIDCYKSAINHLRL